MDTRKLILNLINVENRKKHEANIERKTLILHRSLVGVFVKLFVFYDEHVRVVSQLP